MRIRIVCCFAGALVATSAIKPTAERPAASGTHPGYPIILNESFDGVTAPALPAGWVATLAQGDVGDAKWVTTTNGAYTPLNAAFAPDVAHVTDNLLDTPPVFVANFPDVRPSLVFRHSHFFETGFDGGVVEIKIGGGAFADIISAGGVALSHGYNNTIASNTGNPLAGRQAFTGNSGGYVLSVFRLPAAVFGQNVQFRFRLGTDTSIAATGWRVDNVRITEWAYTDYDLNGDFKTDRTIFRPSNRVWYLSLNGGGSAAVGWGIAGDVDVSADYDGDGKFDVAVWRPSTGTWFIIRSMNGAVMTDQWGQSGDIPMAGVVECCTFDAWADLIIFRPTTGTWFIKATSVPPIALAWGANGDLPMVGDYIAREFIQDIVIYRPSTGVWYIWGDGGQSGPYAAGWGSPGDIPVVGDWDGDSRNDLAVFRPSSGQWWIRNSRLLDTTVANWGMNGDIPIAGDFNGDGRSDFTVWRPSNGVWYTQYSNTGGTAIVGWGVPGDLPVGRRPGS